MPIVWSDSDGSVHVTQLSDKFLSQNRLPGESTDAAVLRLASIIRAKIPSFAGLQPILVRTADLPADRTKRYAWRLSGSRLIVDTNVPIPEERIR